MRDEERMALKLAIDTMERSIKRYHNVALSNREKGIRVEYGQAINILENMLKAVGE